MDKLIASDPSNIKELLDNRNDLKRDLDKLYAKNAKGAQIRSRVKWVEEGEKSSAYFLSLEKKRMAYNTIEKNNI